MSLSLVFALVVAIGAVAFFIGRQRAAAQDDGAVKAAFAAALSRLVGVPSRYLAGRSLIVVWAIGQSVYVDRHIDALVQDEAGEAGAEPRRCRSA